MTQTAERTVPYEVWQREHELRLKAEQDLDEMTRDRDTWKSEYFLLRDMRQAPVLKPVDKAVLQELRHTERCGEVDGPDHTKRANFKTIANNLKISADTVARSSARMEKLGVVKVLERQGPLDEYERKYIRTDEVQLRQLKKLDDPDGVVKKQGGNRYQCQNPACLSYNIELRTVKTLRCLDCKHETEVDDSGWVAQNGHKAQKQLAFHPSKHAERAEDVEATCFSDDMPIVEPQKQLAEHCVYTQSVDDTAAPAEPQKQVAFDIRREPPLYLRNGRIWCCGRAEWNEEKQKYDKVPYIADMKGTNHAKSNEPSTWRTYDYALAVLEKSQAWTQENSPPFDFLMFMCDGSFTFLDQDHCIDKETGEISAEALERARKLDSYTELSWSKDGLHTYAIGALPPGRRRKQGIELYDRGRPCVYTGNPVPGFPLTMERRTEEIAALHAEIFPPQPEVLWTSPNTDEEESSHTDDEMEQLLADVLARAGRAKNRQKFMDLWQGDFGKYYHDEKGVPDQSRADAGLCKMLAFYVGKRVSTVDWLFRRSKLYRPKWERADYREKTFRYAFGEEVA